MQGVSSADFWAAILWNWFLTLRRQIGNLERGKKTHTHTHIRTKYTHTQMYPTPFSATPSRSISYFWMQTEIEQHKFKQGRANLDQQHLLFFFAAPPINLINHLEEIFVALQQQPQQQQQLFSFHYQLLIYQCCTVFLTQLILLFIILLTTWFFSPEGQKTQSSFFCSEGWEIIWRGMVVALEFHAVAYKISSSKHVII